MEEEKEEESSSSETGSVGRVYDGQKKFGSSDSLLPGLYDDVALNCLAWACRSDYASLSCLNKKFNSLMKSGYLYDLRKQLGIVEHWVYMVCDLRGWEAFDPMRNKWMRLPKIPCDECFNLADKESLTVGGSDKNGNVLKSAELYDSKTGRWEMLPSMHSPRRLCSGFFMDEKFYVIGGMTSPTDSLTCGEEYDLKSRKWRKIEGMYPNVNRAAQAPPLVAVVDNQLYAVEYLTNMVKKYDKEKNSWDVLGRLPVRADSSNGWGLAFKACGKELLVVGGQRGPEGEAIVLNSWYPKSGMQNGSLDWKVLGTKDHAGVFVFNCAVMGS
ncbi:Galactose oxidase/kelch repeat superfamily protein [Actinidia rufa]|uniref:Galactose oxidase/kelch repeat superfamily protein n=1 Tax=Actinidia rufa TaxID=165716 RepID=A0A7J0GQW0_9ERIC|nr:Galactose oxidase/kelch repeat superfamily protein [Actinidia rufa]